MCLPNLASLSHSQSLAVCEVEEFCPGAVYVAMMSDSLTERYFRKKNNTFQKHECVPSVHFASIKRRRKKDLREEAGTHFMLYSWQNSYGPYALGER